MDAETSADVSVEAVETGSDTVRGTNQMGVGKDLAAQTAGSAHGPWRLANSPALAMALPNVYFDSLSIPRLFGHH
jgi:RNA-directed DNA polymerase